MNNIPGLTVSELLSQQIVSVGSVVVSLHRAMLILDIDASESCWTLLVDKELLPTRVGLYNTEILLKI